MRMRTGTYAVHRRVTNEAGSNSKFQAGHNYLTSGSGVPGMNLMFLSVVIITALLYFFVSPDIFQNRHIIKRAFLAIAAAAGSFILLYILQLPFTGFNLLLWFSLNAAIALGLNSALANNPKGAIVSGVVPGSDHPLLDRRYYHSFCHDCNPAGSGTGRDGCPRPVRNYQQQPYTAGQLRDRPVAQ